MKKTKAMIVIKKTYIGSIQERIRVGISRSSSLLNMIVISLSLSMFIVISSSIEPVRVLSNVIAF